MSEEISNLNLTKENIALKEQLVKIEEENAELKEQNAELKEQITKLMDKIGAMNSEKLQSTQENPTESSSAILNLQPMKRSHKEEESSDFCPEANKPKFTEKFVPNWLIEVLAWIDRIEMANSSLSFSNNAFKQLCWPKLHLNVEPYEIHYLECSQTHNYDYRAFLRLGDEEDIFSIALIPPPHYITFKELKLNIYDINTEMVNFVKKCAHLIQKCNLELNFNINEISSNTDKKRFELMQNLLECLANKIEVFELYMNLAEFNRLFPGTLDQVKFIDYNGKGSTLLDNDFLVNWLNKQSNQWKQKIIHIQFDKKATNILINRIKEEFLNANFPSIFTICFWTYRKIARNANANQQLTLENARTNEILNIYLKISNYGKYSIYLARYPKGEEQWKQRGEKKY